MLKKPLRRYIVFTIILFISLLSLSAAASDSFLRDVFLSDVPITYGDELFRERILERTNGERDPIGLVLTGGSARACAHIGVLKYLDEEGIVPDFIISNSMGSIIGMLYAAGVSPMQIEELILAGDLSDLFSVTLPIQGGILKPSGFRTLIERLVGKDYRVEDTIIPIMIVNDDLVTKREIRIAEGDFADVLIGSFALPVYFDPFEYRGHLLVDGGIISLAPLNVAYDYSDTIILSTTFYDQENLDLINPITILNTSFDIGKRQRAASELKEHDNFIFIRCEVEEFSFMAFDKAIELADIGYESAKKVSAELSTLYHASTTEGDNLVGKHVDKDVQLTKIKKDLRNFGFIQTSVPTTLLELEMRSMAFEDTRYFLADSMSFGISYKYLYHGLNVGIATGFGVDTSDFFDSAMFMNTNAYLAYYPFSQMRFTFEGSVNAGRKFLYWMPILFSRQAIDFIPYTTPKMKILLSESMEYYKDFGVTENSAALLFALLGSLRWDFSHSKMRANIGYLFSGDSILFAHSRNTMDVNFEGRFFVDGGNHLFIDAKAFARFGIDKSDNPIPFFVNDGYTSTMLAYGGNGLKSPAKYLLAIIGTGFGIEFKASPSFGEFLLLDNSVIGLYGDMLIADKALGFSCGVEIQTRVSLIGLIKFPFRFRIGYEYTLENESAMVGSLLFNLRY